MSRQRWKREAQDMRAGMEAIERVTGQRPLGWYTGRDSPNTRRLVVEYGGFLYDSDYYGDDLPFWTDVEVSNGEKRLHLIVPYSLDANDMRFATSQGFNTAEHFFSYLRDTFDVLYEGGTECPKMMSAAPSPTQFMTDFELHSNDTTLHEDRLWHDNGWTARVIKNEDDDGWAVEMIKDGEAEPTLVGPWTMGRDKKNPKPLDTNAFRTLVKTASEVLRRHEQQRHAMLHKAVTVWANNQDVTVTLDIVPDEDNPYAELRGFDPVGTPLGHVKVSTGFKLSKASAEKWVKSDFARPD
ncbi:hypothetical protein DFQ30_008950 [Apophysomyces sp. BC1015]|nr:hypothetical protein DFQ30_008950 [Apophysomyces sp. BC1015]